jgi:hypothetical protein
MLECTLQVFSSFVCKPISFLQISIYSAGVLLAIFFQSYIVSLSMDVIFVSKAFFGHWILYCIVNYIMTGIVRLGGGGST